MKVKLKEDRLSRCAPLVLYKWAKVTQRNCENRVPWQNWEKELFLILLPVTPGKFLKCQVAVRPWKWETEIFEGKGGVIMKPRTGFLVRPEMDLPSRHMINTEPETTSRLPPSCLYCQPVIVASQVLRWLVFCYSLTGETLHSAYSHYVTS